MTDIGLNIDRIREINKLKVQSVKNGGQIEDVFEAYLTQAPGSFSAKVDVDSFTEQLGNMIKGLGITYNFLQTPIGQFAQKQLTGGGTALGNLVGSSIDLSNNINYNQNYRFTGIGTLERSFSCELVVKDDYLTDVIRPLWSILEYVLPDETEPLKNTTLYKVIEGGLEKGFNYISNATITKNDQDPFIDPDILKSFWNAIKTMGGEIGDSAGSVSILKKPKQLQGGMSHTRLRIGDYIIIDDVIITDVKFEIPYLFYENGLFDKVGVDLTVKGNRKMSLKTYDWIKYLSRGSLGYNITHDSAKPIVKTLNQEFVPDMKPMPRTRTVTI